MSAIAQIEPALAAGVADFLRRHKAEIVFQSVCDAVRICFPELRSLRVRLLDDPDEEGRTWVVLRGSLPASHSLEYMQEQRGRYYDMLGEQVPFNQEPPFSLTMDFQSIGRTP